MQSTLTQDSSEKQDTQTRPRRALFGWLSLTAYIVLIFSWQLQGLFSYYELQADLHSAEERYVPMPTDTDCAQWAVLASQALEEGSWTVKYNPNDNYPHGAPVHWSSSLVWGGLLGSKAWAWITGEKESYYTVYWGFTLVPTVLLLLMGPPLFILGRRLWGELGGWLVGAGFVFAPGSHTYLGPSAWDHHGLIIFGTLVFFMGIFGGCQGRGVKWWGLGGGAAAFTLWVGPLSFVPIFLATLAGAGMSGIFRAWNADPSCREGDAWTRGWKCFLGVFLGGAVIFYLLEYGLSLHFRMESNNPVTILSLFSAGVCVGMAPHLLNWRRELRDGRMIYFPLAVAGAMVIPAIVLLGGEAFYSPADPEFGRFLHTVKECKPMAAGTFTFSYMLFASGAVAMVFLLLLLKKRPDYLVVIVPAVLSVVLALLYSRWYHNAALFIFMAVAVLGAHREEMSRRVASVLAAILFLWLSWGVSMEISGRSGKISPEVIGRYRSGGEGRQLAEAVADDWRSLGREGLDDGPIVLTGPEVSNYLAYYLRTPTVGRMSWEGFPGFRRWAVALGTEGDEEIKRLIEETGGDYLFIGANHNTLLYMLHGRRVIMANQSELDHFALTLLRKRGELPSWLQEIPAEGAVGKLYRILPFDGGGDSNLTGGGDGESGDVDRSSGAAEQ